MIVILFCDWCCREFIDDDLVIVFEIVDVCIVVKVDVDII